MNTNPNPHPSPPPKNKAPPGRDGSIAPGSSHTMREPIYSDSSRLPAGAAGLPPPHRFDRFIDGFRRDPNQRVAPKDPFEYMPAGEAGAGAGAGAGLGPAAFHRTAAHGTSAPYDVRWANLQTSRSHLARRLKGRHLQMIAIGGSIGTGLFVASGRALEAGGPASLLLGYSFIGAMLFCTIQALGELAVAFPVAGSFSSYSTRFLHPSWGFAMGWNYAMQWLCVLPLEIVAASITIDYWHPNTPRAVFVTIFLALIVLINFFGVRGYGEAEFIFAIVKVVAVVGFILLGIVLNIGGTPDGGYIGVQYWHNPGAFHNGFQGVCSTFVMAAFAFAGTELVGLAAAETANPRKSLPTAIKQVFWRITLFYVVCLTLIGLLVPYNDGRLLMSDISTESNSAASPFVIAIENAGIEVLPSVMNVVILISVLSVGNSSVFGSSRTLAALADQDQAPRLLSYIDRRGRPLVAIAVASAMGLLAYLADLEQQSAVLDWLLAISGLSCIFTWGSICLAHVRFRQAWRAQGHSLSELAFTSQCGVVGSWVGFACNVLVLAAQFWVGAWPIGYEGLTATQRVSNFFLKYMAAPIVAVFFLAHRFWARASAIRLADIDVDTGRRDMDLPIIVSQEREERRSWPRWKRIYKYLC